jgi:propanediol dehydratase small subunit
MMNDIRVTLKDYPFGRNRTDLIKTLSGKRLEEITLNAILDGEITDQDVRISSQTLLLQAEIAELTGRKRLAANFRRAAELCHVPDDKVMKIYNSLRPFRCNRQELEAIASELEHDYQAVLNAELVREACDAYEKRGFLRKISEPEESTA